MAKTWLNGELVDEAEASISVRDAGLLHGAGLFTTMRAYAGKVFRLADHLERLRNSCQELFVPLLFTDEQVTSAIEQLIQANALTDARIRLTVTRGEIIPGVQQQGEMRPNAFITAIPLEPYPQEYFERGLTVIANDQQKLNPYDIQAGHKTLDYFSRFAGLREAVSRGAAEAIWFNVHNYLQSATVGNVFIAKGGKVFTPPTQHELSDPEIARRTPYPKSNVLPGITRKVVLEILADEKIPVEIGPITIQQLLDAEECFMTNSIMEVMPICRIERKAVGTDKPGALTRRIAMLYRSKTGALVRGA